MDIKNGFFILKRKRMNQSGLTLMEIMIVVAIVGVLLVIAVPNYIRVQEQGNVSKAKGELRTLQIAVENYYIHNSNTYPAALSDLTSATPNIVSAVPDDPFASSGSYGYVRGGTSNGYYVIYSVGPDGNGSATISSDAVSETNGTSCIFVSNAGEDTAP